MNYLDPRPANYYSGPILACYIYADGFTGTQFYSWVYVLPQTAFSLQLGDSTFTM